MLARLATDPAQRPPELPRPAQLLPSRKRAIGQLLVRDDEQRVLLCQLTYKRDWDLPGVSSRSARRRTWRSRARWRRSWAPAAGGPAAAHRLAAGVERLGRRRLPGLDGGRRPASLTDTVVCQEREIRCADFCTLEQVRDRTADFTARRIEAALRVADDVPGAPIYTESGRPVGG
ncbi:MAG: hypothetical protein R2734_16855 [Nocardioides sp.]